MEVWPEVIKYQMLLKSERSLPLWESPNSHTHYIINSFKIINMFNIRSETVVWSGVSVLDFHDERANQIWPLVTLWF